MASEAKQLDHLDVDEEERDEPGPHGIGGWLIIPVITLVVVAFEASSSILDSQLSRVSQELLAGNLVLTAASVALLALMFSRNELLPMMMVVFYLVLLGVRALEYVAVDQLMFGVTQEIAPDAIGEATQHLRRSVASAIIWIPYFLVSRRVKNTFVR